MNIREIARLSGVSTATVSRVLNGNVKVQSELRERVQKVIQDANYVPNAIARSMNHGTTSIVGLILPDITNPFFPSIARGVEDAAASRGYKVILCNTDNHVGTEETYLRMLREQRVDGIILVSANQISEEHLSHIVDDIPLVLCDRAVTTGRFSSVTTDHAVGVALAVRHLMEAGHREVAMIAGPRVGASPPDRSEAFQACLEFEGLRWNPHRVKCGDYRYESGYYAMQGILSDADVTAVICANDLMALGAMNAALDSGRMIPQDISIVGYDNIPAANWSRPALTTVAQSTYSLGMVAVETLTEILSGTTRPPIHRLLEPRLIIRKSTSRVSL